MSCASWRDEQGGMCFNWFSRVKNRSSALISSAMIASCVPGYASKCRQARFREGAAFGDSAGGVFSFVFAGFLPGRLSWPMQPYRSEEHTSELQSHSDLVCRLLLEKKKTIRIARDCEALNRKTSCFMSYHKILWSLCARVPSLVTTTEWKNSLRNHRALSDSVLIMS